MAGALGKHPQLIAWQIDSNGLGGHLSEFSFNEQNAARLARVAGRPSMKKDPSG